MHKKPFIATAVQHPPVYLDLEKSIEKACDLIAQAAHGGAKLIVFPETWLAGYPVWFDLAPGATLWGSEAADEVYQRLFTNSPSLDDPTIESLCKAAKAAKAIVVMGLHERDGHTLYNTILYINAEGNILGHHRKLVPTYTERLIWGRGDGSTLEVFDTPLGRIGGLICWEHWMPLARYTFHGQQEQIHIAQWPTVKTMHQIASRHYAFEGSCTVIAAGTVLYKDDLNHLKLPLLDEIPDEPEGFLMRGGSCIIGPDGTFLAEPVFNKSTFVTAEIDLSDAISHSMTLDVVGHYSRPDIFTLQVNTEPQSNIELGAVSRVDGKLKGKD
jgi:predicted amidohydrolase